VIYKHMQIVNSIYFQESVIKMTWKLN